MDKDCVPNVQDEVIRKRLNQIEVKALQLYRYGYSQGNFESGKKAEKAFADGYAAGQSEGNGAYQCGYEAGRDATWSLIQRLFDSVKETGFDAAFDKCNGICDIINTYTPEEVFKRLEEIKQEAEISETPTPCGYKDLSVGMEVKDCSDCIGVITNIDTAIHVLYKNGKTHKWGKNTKFLPTGQLVANIWEWMG